MARQPAPAQKRAQGHAGALPCPGWPSPRDVHALRAERGFVTPLHPLEPGGSYCLFASADLWEWLFHPSDAAHYLEHGITVNGKPCRVEYIADYPLMGAWHLRASHTDRGTTFVEDRRAA